MPRPNPAQLACGSATVILSALVMLLVTQTRSGTGVTVVATAALALGLLVAVTVPVRRPADRSRPAAGSVPAQRGPARTGTGDAGSGQRVPQPSLRR
ncbi:hypothetical protein V1L54_00335 [Streptomyces sp. TRM 70361]|uniref:hypothetical protein n=1 Tax=Streptomyces sp. TRM 70361 TaxID=3116553 RepID=UPI002E7B9460|nr:hypothetical protein [Streptomyces sp. TRM 70361]MEE1937882.1 hypothetical protein [Streptomyces sp. TRM 70361]